MTHINNLSNDVKIHEIACPLFVPIVEEGLENSDIALLTSRMYLSQINSLSIDTLILGCTHYPMLLKTIRNVINDDIKIIDTGASISGELSQIISNINSNNKKQSNEYYVSDLPYRFNDLASKFLNNPIKNVQQVEL